MNIAEYRKFVGSMIMEPLTIKSNLDPVRVNMLHMGLGLIAEIGEYITATSSENNEDILSELGDCLFYSTGFDINLKKVRPEFDFDLESFPSVHEVEYICLDFAELLKKYCLLGKDKKLDELAESHKKIDHCLAQLLSYHLVTEEQISANNHIKLTGRHPSGVFDPSNKD